MFDIDSKLGFLDISLELDNRSNDDRMDLRPDSFAPLLLTDLALLGMLGIFNLVRKGQTVTQP